MVEIDHAIKIDQKEILVKEKIGSGTFGKVYSAFWRTAEVAVKKINIKGATLEAIKSLESELHTLVKVQHPYLLRIYGVCEASVDELWIIMESATGKSLAYNLQNKGIHNSTKEEWMIEAAQAVAYLHSRRIIHKAINSNNFLLVDGVLKLADFGMEAAVGIQKASGGLQADPHIIAPVYSRWRAPESHQGHYTEQSDIFSLGMVLWEITSRTVPLPELTTDEEVMKAIKEDQKRPVIPVESHRAEREWISKCWDDAPSNRPTAANVAMALESAHPQLPPQPRKPEKDRKYFEVNFRDLDKCVPPANIKTMPVAEAPEFPIKGPIPNLPREVQRYMLIPDIPSVSASGHPLVSQRYDHKVCQRVKEYFDRFYKPSDPTLEATLNAVEVIYNKEIEIQFERENERFNEKYAGLEELCGIGQSELQKQYLANLFSSENRYAGQSSNPISAWHGVASDKLDSICWYGMLNLNSNDGGYFGRGIYLTQEPNYGEYYARNLSHGEGKSCLLLCWVLLGRPAAITNVRMGAPPEEGYSSHYVVVKKKLSSRKICKTAQDYERVNGVTTYFPVETINEKEGDEIVVFRTEQVLPRYIVHYTVKKKDQGVLLSVKPAAPSTPSTPTAPTAPSATQTLKPPPPSSKPQSSPKPAPISAKSAAVNRLK